MTAGLGPVARPGAAMKKHDESSFKSRLAAVPTCPLQSQNILNSELLSMSADVFKPVKHFLEKLHPGEEELAEISAHIQHSLHKCDAWKECKYTPFLREITSWSDFSQA